MLGAGLRREFPGASSWIARAARRALPLRVARTSLGWAVLAGFGTQAIVTAVVGSLAAIVFAFVELPRDWRDPFAVRSAIITLLGAAAGASVARRSGGWPALAGFGVALALFQLVGAAAAEPGRALFCERAGGAPDLAPCVPRTLQGEVLARWPVIVGIAAALLIARRNAAVARETNGALEAVGALAALEPLTRVALALSLPPGEGLSTTHLAALVAMHIVYAMGGGIVLVWRDAFHWRTTAMVAAAYYGLPLVAAAVFFLRYPASAPPREHAWFTAAPAAYAAAFVLAALVTAALARSRPPDAGAARRAPR